MTADSSGPSSKAVDREGDQATSYKGGSLAELSFKQKRQSKPPRPQVGRGKRKPTRGLSRSSRLEFLRRHAKINADKVLKEGAIFVTLTFPEDKWVGGEAESWRGSREKFKRRLDRFDEKIGERTLGSWRLELATEEKPCQLHPHLHLLLFCGIARRPLRDVREWMGEAWYESCGKLSEEHRNAGTSVEKIRTRTDWSRLTRYVGKEEFLQDPPETKGACGWWGWKNEIEKSFIDPNTVKLFRDESIEVRERLANTSGYRLPEPLYPMQTFIPHEEFQKMLGKTRESLR